jgi:methionyl-tRNA formyltransferase
MALAPVPAQPQRLVYLGTPAMAVPPLEALVRTGYDVRLVVTRPDTRRGRGAATSPSPVKAAASAAGIPVSHDVDDALQAGAELGVVVAFGKLIRAHVLAQLPMINVHFSLVPRWRGAAPVERALLAGDTETGVCVMQVEEGLDTGPVYGCRAIPIPEQASLAAVRDELVVAGTDLLLRCLAAGLTDPRPQVGEATYAAKIEPSELDLDWRRPAVELERVVRLGGAWTTFRGKRLKVLRAEPVHAALVAGALDGDVVGAGGGGLRLLEVQPEGRGPMSPLAWRNGVQPEPGESLGS